MTPGEGAQEPQLVGRGGERGPQGVPICDTEHWTGGIPHSIQGVRFHPWPPLPQGLGLMSPRLHSGLAQTGQQVTSRGSGVPLGKARPPGRPVWGDSEGRGRLTSWLTAKVPPPIYSHVAEAASLMWPLCEWTHCPGQGAGPGAPLPPSAVWPRERLPSLGLSFSIS